MSIVGDSVASGNGSRPVGFCQIAKRPAIEAEHAKRPLTPTSGRLMATTETTARSIFNVFYNASPPAVWQGVEDSLHHLVKREVGRVDLQRTVRFAERSVFARGVDRITREERCLHCLC